MAIQSNPETVRANQNCALVRVSKNTVRLRDGRLIHFPLIRHARGSQAGSVARAVWQTLQAAGGLGGRTSEPIAGLPARNLPLAPIVRGELAGGGSACFIMDNLQNSIRMLRPLSQMPDCERLAMSIAWTLARFHRDGRVELNTRGGKKISRAEAKAGGRKVRAVVYAGSGSLLPAQDVFELYLSARAALLAEMAGGKTPREAWRAGAQAARRTLYVSRREPTYSDEARAHVARDRAFKRFAESFAAETGGENQPQPHAAEFLISSRDDENLNPRALVLGARKRARLAIAAHYAAKHYPRAGADKRRDVRTMRALSREILVGIATQTKRDDEATYQRNLDLSRRVQSGFDLLAARAELESAPAAKVEKRASRAPRETFALPIGRAENVARDIALSPYVARLVSRADERAPAPLEALHALAAHFAH